VAKKTIILDDLDGTSEAAETILFLYDGEYREIDLSAENIEKLGKALAKYIAASRVVPAKEAQRRITTDAGSGLAYGDYDPAAVRTWARENGIEVPDKGRVPEMVVTRWRQATAG